MNPKKITIKKSSPQKKEGGKSSSHYHGPKGQLAVDVYQTSDEFVVKSPIGGIDLDDVKVMVDNGILIIKGERQEGKKEEGRDYFFQECHWGVFERQIILPEDVDPLKIKANLEKGILTILAPRAKKIKKKKVKIQGAE